MIRSVVKSFKVPDVDVVAARMSNESALTRMTDSTQKKTWSDLTLVLDGWVDSNFPDEGSSWLQTTQPTSGGAVTAD